MYDEDPVSKYASLDLSPNGHERKELDMAVEREAQNGHIKLTDHVGDTPPNLTPEMLIWFDMYIRSHRKAALDYVASQFDAMSNGNKATGVFLERRLDDINDKKIAQKRQTREAHEQKNAARFAELKQAQREAETAHIRYENLEIRHNRSPRLPPWWYVPALVLLLPAEGGINFETFMAVKWMTPAFALGTVIILGVVLALSAHLYGHVAASSSSAF